MSPDIRPPPVPWRTAPRGALGLTLGLAGAMFLALFGSAYVWFFCRIEPPQGHIAILIRKTGTDLPSGQILAELPGQKGIQLDVLPEGRYFKNPYTWDWRIARIIDIPAGKLGVQVRLFGKELPSGDILAQAGTKGILSDILRPGKYRINPFAYNVELFDAISVRPGTVGVVTSLTGQDVLNSELPEEERNTMLVKEGRKGVLTTVLDPGTHYLNPYLVNVVEVNLQSQRFEMSGEDTINFLTLDGFNVNVEGTIEFGILREQAAWITHRVGDMEDVVKKVILPRARGFSRIEGSKHPAKNFIVGETRQQFQDNLEKHLVKEGAVWGVAVRSVLIRNIAAPEEISSVIREREVAVQNALKFQQQIEQAKSQAELARQEMLAEQNKEKVESDTARIRAVILAEQEQAVRMTTASQELAVARINNEAAAAQVLAIVAKAEAERDVVKLNNEAEAGVLAGRTKAFGNGMNYARYQFYQKVGPRISSVVSSDQSDGLGSLFLPFLPAKKEVQP
jgi:regulator of protease activity HflC (stomatin/prohibitin superfamily)